ncbi:MAG: gamma-glutamyl-phosphate reductase, partial [Cyanobacteria bacterium J06623_7]
MVASQTKSLSLVEVAQQTRAAALKLAVLATDDRNTALEAIAQGLEAATPEIIAANQADLEAAESDNIAPALYSRLKLGETKLQAAIAGVRDVAKLADPVGVSQ